MRSPRCHSIGLQPWCIVAPAQNAPPCERTGLCPQLSRPHVADKDMSKEGVHDELQTSDWFER